MDAPTAARSPSISRNRPFVDDNEEEDHARRYEDFTTIDWIQDTLLERSRRMREETGAAGKSTIQGWLWTIIEAGQSWFVVALVGAAIGMNSAIISIVTEWLSDIKMGYCNTGWWLNQKFCCWEIEPSGSVDGGGGEEGCDDWVTWSKFSAFQYVAYVFFSIGFASSCAFIVRSFAPYAAGSGISEIKCILAGFVIHGFLSLRTLIIKSLTLPLVIASGLSVGKEGPSVHVASCIGNVVARYFDRFNRSQAKMREIVAAASAAGVAVAFGSPIGGVLFALEEMTINFPIKTMWRSFLCALVATVTLSVVPFIALETGKIVLFQVSYDRDWHFFEVGFFIIIGIFGGLYGAFVIKYNLQIQGFRRRHLTAYPITEVVILSMLTAVVGYFNRFLRIDMTESLDILFRECEGGGDYDGLCQTWAQWRMVNSLLLATVLRTCLVIISYGCKVPAGIFVPSMAVGATFGRMVGILVKAMHRSYPHWSIFAACEPEKPCITPGTYALLGAAAALGGIMRITVTVVVIMFELTGALTYILPTMIVLMVTKAVSDFFGKAGIADEMIKFNGFPFLDKEDHVFNNIPVSEVMKRDVVALPAVGMKLDELEARLAATPFRGFPIIQSRNDRTLLGYITKTDVHWAIDKARRTSILEPDAACVFATGDEDVEDMDLEDEPPESGDVYFSPWVNSVPLAVSPRQPLEIVMQLFKKMGPRVILIEEHGKLVGLISIKDILRHTIEVEKQGHGNLALGDDADFEETLEEAFSWVRSKMGAVAQLFGRRSESPPGAGSGVRLTDELVFESEAHSPTSGRNPQGDAIQMGSLP